MLLIKGSVHPPKGAVLLRALIPSKTKGGIIIPTDYRPRWYPLGEVIESRGREGLRKGDWVITEDEGLEVDRSYYDVFRIDLRDHKEALSILVDIEAEPPFREMMEKYYAEPSKYRQYWFTLKDLIRDETLKFQPPDVLDFSFDIQPNPTYKLEYIPTAMIHLWTGEKYELHYVIDERKILAVIGRGRYYETGKGTVDISSDAE